MNDNLSKFYDAMREHGLVPPDNIEPGQLYRFPGMGKKAGNTAGWCVLFLDSNGGSFGDWSTGLSENWQAKRDKPYMFGEQEAINKRVKQARAVTQSGLTTIRTAAATRASELWMSTTEATAHPYLERKRVLPLGIRQKDGLLVIPVRDIDGHLCSCQTIDGAGNKRFMTGGKIKGCFYLIGAPINSKVFICEGFATGASIFMHGDEIGAKGKSIVVAFNAKNLKLVAEAIAFRYPQTEIIICADNDHDTPGNPGLKEGRAAATWVNAKLVYPKFEDNNFLGTDFNDYVNAGGVL